MKSIVFAMCLLAPMSWGQNPISLLNVPAQQREIEIPSQSFLTEVSFELIQGMIIVEGQLNGKKGNFLLDTGSPMLVVNQTTPGEERISANSLHRSFEVSLIRIDQFSWASVQRQQFEAVALDIRHLEKACQRKLLGLIGFDILKDFEVLIDYERKRIVLLHPKDNLVHKVASPKATIPFELIDHLAVFPLTVGGKNFYFALDSGSGSNLLDAGCLPDLPTAVWRYSHQEEIQSLDQSIREASTIEISESSLEAFPLSGMFFLVTDLSHIQAQLGVPVQGLLGFPFLKKTTFSINFPDKKIFIWESAEIADN